MQALSETPLYNTAAVVQRTGVRATTIRAWERRYGYPQPARDPSQQRLYSERDIEGIRWLSEQTAHGVAISRAVAMLQSGHPPAVVPAPVLRATPRAFTALRADLLVALLALDVAGAERVLSEAFALYSVEDVCLEVIEPLLVDVGERWHAGDLSVAEEHYVSSFIRSRLFVLLNAYQRPDPGGPLVFTACAPDEWHEVGILLVSVFLARRNIGVRYLGPSLPLDALEKIAAVHHPAVVVLSAQSPQTARQLRRASRRLRAGRPPHPRFVFGGQVFNTDLALRDSIAGTYAGATAAAASVAIADMLRGSAARRGG